jgi:uncharacterized membrane protein
MKKIKNYFLQGLLYITPIGITVYLIYVLFNFVNNILGEVLENFLQIDIPGLGLVVIFFSLVLVGIIGTSFIAKPIKALFHRFLERTPLLKLIYSALNDLFSAFVGEERKFNKPVIVLVNPISNLEKLGFLTEQDLSKIDENNKVAVYFPHSYNFSGELFIVPKSQVRPINLDPAVVMKFIVSGGVSSIYEK